MPPFNQNPQVANQETEVKQSKMDLASQNLSKKLNNVSESDIKSILKRVFDTHEHENPFSVKIMSEIESRCPEGLDRIEFEQWIEKRVASFGDRNLAHPDAFDIKQGYTESKKSTLSE